MYEERPKAPSLRDGLYEVIDLKTRNRLALCKTRVAASRKADKIDLAYGAICCFVRYVA